MSTERKHTESGQSPGTDEEFPDAHASTEWSDFQPRLVYHITNGTIAIEMPTLLDEELFGTGTAVDLVRPCVRMALRYTAEHGASPGSETEAQIAKMKIHKALRPPMLEYWSKLVTDYYGDDAEELKRVAVEKCLNRARDQMLDALSTARLRGTGYDEAEAHHLARCERIKSAGEASTSKGEQTVESPEPYRFQPAFPEDHFVSQVIAHMRRRTDAVEELMEAGALMLLAVATPNVIVHVGAHVRGLHTNLFILGIGESTRSRKSTVLDITKTIHQACEAVREGVLPNKMTPEAFLEELAARDGKATGWYFDEFGAWLGKLHSASYMEEAAGHLLTVYDCTPTSYARHSKRIKGGGKEEDRDVVERPRLSLFGVTTESVFTKLSSDDVESGLLPRFAVAYPQGLRPRRSLWATEEGLAEETAALVTRLGEIAAWNANTAVAATLTPEAKILLDDYDERIEMEGIFDKVGGRMHRRLSTMLGKVALLAAAGRPGLTWGKLEVTGEDVESAVKVLTRWEDGARRFVEHLGASEFERNAVKALDHLKRLGSVERKPVNRRELSRHCKVPKRVLDDIEATLQDRGEITVSEAPRGGKMWRICR